MPNSTYMYPGASPLHHLGQLACQLDVHLVAAFDADESGFPGLRVNAGEHEVANQIEHLVPDGLIWKTQRLAESIGSQTDHFVGNSEKLMFLQRTECACVEDVFHGLVF